jgi:putative ABC transport system substrate-binding protein
MRCAAILVTVLAVLGDPAAAVRIVVLLSSGDAYRAIETGVRQELAEAPEQYFVVLVRGVEEAEPDPRTDIVLAIGTEACAAARSASHPVVSVSFESEECGSSFDRGGATVHAGVSLRISADLHLELIQRLDPGARRIGILYDPLESTSIIDEARNAARARGMQIVAAVVRSPFEVIEAIRLITPAVDAFLLLDPSILTSATESAVLLHAMRVKKPLFALSEPMVRRGALAAVTADLERSGAKAASLALQLLERTVSRRSLLEAAPTALFVNTATAQRLGVTLDSSLLYECRRVYP